MEGIDYHEIFSPVVKVVSICIVLTLVGLLDLELKQLSHGDLEEEFYMEQPKYFVQHQKGRLVCKLKKSLYDLEQSPRKWYRKFDSFMVSQGYYRSEYDHFLYFKRLNDIFIILVLYVDDMLIVRKSMDEINRLKARMAKNFHMKDIGDAI